MLLQTDASLLSLGMYQNEMDTSIGGRWSVTAAQNHTKFLELSAIFCALGSFCSDLKSGSTCAVAYICNMGGMASLEMDRLARGIWQWCLARELFLSASHISGMLNIDADFPSTNFSDSTEWMLKKAISSGYATSFCTRLLQD